MLAGCPAPWARTADQAPRDQAPHDQAGNAVLEIVPEFRNGNYLSQAEIKPYTRTDIQQLDLELIRLEQDGEAWKLPATLNDSNRKLNRIESSQLNQTIRFGSLRPNTGYRIRWYAFNATGDLTPDSASRISVDGSRDLVIGIDDSVTVETLTIQLKDRPFNATATLEGMDVIDGGYTYPGAETIDLETP